MIGKLGSLPKQLRNRIVVDAESGCWLWGGTVSGKGYGRVYFDGRHHASHRAIYQLLVGPISDGLELDHLCRVRRCANPSHLEPVTHAENVRRGRVVGNINHANRVKTHCCHGHPFDDANTYHDLCGRRHCRTCRSNAMRAFHKRKKISKVKAD